MSVTNKPWLPSELTVAQWNEDFINTYVFSSCSAIFDYTYGCGYWGFGVAYDKDLGWLIYEHQEEGDYLNRDFDKEIAIWRAGEKLPDRFFRWNSFTGVDVFLAGCKKRGVEWYDRSFDIGDIEVMMQWVFFGEIRYG